VLECFGRGEELYVGDVMDLTGLEYRVVKTALAYHERCGALCGRTLSRASVIEEKGETGSNVWRRRSGQSRRYYRLPATPAPPAV